MQKLHLVLEHQDGTLEKIKFNSETINKIKKYIPVFIALLIVIQMVISLGQSYINNDYNYFIFALIASVIEGSIISFYFAYNAIKSLLK